MRLTPLVVALVTGSVALAGCLGGDKDAGGPRVEGPEPKPSELPGKVEHVVANEGYRVTADPRGAMVKLKDRSAVEVKVNDVVDADGKGALDKASVTVDAREDKRTVVGLRQMVAGPTSDDPDAKEYYGGVAHNVPVFGATGRGPKVLPQVNAYVWIAGKARVEVDGVSGSATHLVWIALTQGLRAPSGGAVNPTVDPNNLQLHVILPGRLLAGGTAIAGAPDGFLYYVFELVGVRTLDETARKDVGKDLLPPEVVNRPPVPSFQTLVAGKATDRGARGRGNLTVALDASQSTDPDAGDSIKAYSWRILVKDAKGALVAPTESPATASGVRVTYNFTIEGVKYIELVLRDGRGASANLTRAFYVSREYTETSLPGANLHAQSVSGYTACKRSLNCFSVTFTAERDILGAAFHFTDNGSTSVEGIHLDAYAPGESPGDPPATPADTPIASATGVDLAVPASKLVPAGSGYEVWAWWERGVGVNFDLDVKLNFAPASS